LKNIPLSIWPILVVFIVLSSIGDVMMSKAMTLIGDLGVIRRERGLFGAMGRVFGSGWFWVAISSMAGSFFTLLIALNRADLSFVVPASSSFSFILNTLAAKFYLREKVDARRWTAAGLVCVGVFLLTK
jgi:uncharacterized membrane protein